MKFIELDSSLLNLNKVQVDTKKKFLKAIDEHSIVLHNREECLCGSANKECIANIDRFGLPFKSLICISCGLVMTQPILSEESLSLYYNRFYHPLTYGTESTIEYLYEQGQGAKIFNIMEEYLKTNKLNVFELGAGSGSNLDEFRSAAKLKNIDSNLYGLEFNIGYVEKARKFNINLDSISLDDFAKKNDVLYDVIILSHVLEHFVNIKETLELLKSIGHKDTLFYIEVPGLLDLKTRYEYDCNLINYLTHAHIFNFSLQSLISTLSLYGLELIKGNEKIESIFKCSENTEVLDKSNSYKSIVSYLKDLEENHRVYSSKNPQYRLYKRTIRKIKGIIKGFLDK